MRRLVLAFASVAVIAAAGFAVEAKPTLPKVPVYVAAAMADKGRPEADVKLDEARRPGELLAFAGLKPGMKVADFMPGGGYFTRLFAKAVGPKGVVYAYVPGEQIKANPKAEERAQGLAKDYGNVRYITSPVNAFATPEKVDMVWTSLNYHDLHDPFMGPADLGQVNAAVFKALKPGGVYVVIDHVAADGSGLRDTDTLHRIDPKTVVAEVTKAGFKLEATSTVLANPEDDHTKKVFDTSIRRHTDQFVYRFRKPRH